MNKTENPSAFPWANDADKQYNWISRGMTLRDYFAAKALHYCLKNCFTTEGAVEDAYKVADAMLKAREA
jgi:hypothetical protein